MNCPFCDTKLKDHEVNRCSNAWVAKLMGYTLHYVGTDSEGKKYKKTAGLELGEMWVDVPPLTTSLDCFMAEVWPLILRRYPQICVERVEGHSKDYLWWVYEDIDIRDVFVYGNTINEALFRAAVQVLSE